MVTMVVLVMSLVDMANYAFRNLYVVPQNYTLQLNTITAQFAVMLTYVVSNCFCVEKDIS